MSDTIVYVDIADQPIEVGSIVCYAALWSRSATLRYGRVTALKIRGGSPYGPVSERVDRATLRVFAIDRLSKTVPVENDWVVEVNWEVINKGSPITLGFLDRLLVVPDSLVPPEALKLLRQ